LTNGADLRAKICSIKYRIWKLFIDEQLRGNSTTKKDMNKYFFKPTRKNT